ncbi:MAG: helix-turn-helix domain-containing protein [Roseibium sp.]
MQETNIPVMQLDTGNVPEKHRFEAWRQWVSPIIDVAPGESQLAKGTTVTTRLLDNLIFGDFTLGAQTMHRDARHINSPHSEILMLDLYSSGHARGLVEDAYVERTPGVIDITDYSRQSQIVASDATFLSVAIPHCAIGYDPARHPANFRIPTDTPVGRVLADAFLTLHAQLPQATMVEAPALAAGFCGLVSGLLFGPQAGAGGPDPVKRGRLDAMKSYIENNLAEPALGVEHLCRTFGASRASVYRDFAELGGVRHFITQSRLDQAFRDLLRAEPVRGQVQDIAARWGFDSAGHFNRLFRRKFGESPSATLGLLARNEIDDPGNLTSGSSANPSLDLTNWIRRL